MEMDAKFTAKQVTGFTTQPMSDALAARPHTVIDDATAEEDAVLALVRARPRSDAFHVTMLTALLAVDCGDCHVELDDCRGRIQKYIRDKQDEAEIALAMDELDARINNSNA